MIPMKKTIVFTALMPALLLASGCASIVDGGPNNLRVGSTPPGAKVTVINKEGVSVTQGTTPITVSLKRGAGFFTPATYRLVFEQPGYETTETTVKARLNGWYFGNIIFGGLLGILIIDPATGAMWTLPENSETALTTKATAAAGEQRLTIVFRQRVSEADSRLLIPIIDK